MARRWFWASLGLVSVGLSFVLWRLQKAEEVVVPVATSSASYDRSTQSVASPVKGTTKDIVVKHDNSTVKAKLLILDQILDTKNDNDPRLDSDFKTLNTEEKAALREKYSQYKRESLNERGTIVFLIGRNLESKEDVDFIESVLLEQPCASLENCNVPLPLAKGEAAHFNSLDNVTLNYPQIVSIKSLEGLLQKDSPLKPLAKGVLERASTSQSPIIANLARGTLARNALP